LRAIRRTLKALAALGCGIAISLGLASFLFGELNRMSMSFLAIMFGIGIDFGIYLIRRTDEELRKGLERRDAVGRALMKSGQGIVAGGLVTALAFSVTAVSEFRGTSQLGLVTAMSVVVVLVTTLLLLPPLLMQTPAPKSSTDKSARVRRNREREAAKEGFPSGPRRSVAGLGLLGFLAVAVFGIVVAPRVPVDYNGLSVMPRDSESTEYQRRMQEESDFQMTSAVVRAPDRESLRKLVEQVRELPSVARVVTMGDLIPEGQEETLNLLRECPGVFEFSSPIFYEPSRGAWKPADYTDAMVRFEDSLYEAQELAFAGGQAELTGALQETLDRVEDLRDSFKASPENAAAGTLSFEKDMQSWLDRLEKHAREWRSLEPVTEDLLPSGFVNRFRSSRGNYAAFVYPAGSVWEMEFLDTFLGELRSVAPDVTGFPVVSESNVGLLTKGIFQSLLLTVAVVIVLLAIDLRKWMLVIYALFPLLVGMSLLHAWLFVSGQQYNLASINGLPLLLGLHIVHRWSEVPGQSAFAAVRTSGKAICLAGVTTMAGLASLTLCIHQGVATFGWMLLQGIVCMLVASLFALPCAIDFFSVRRKEDDS
jgi:predicted RND superfamily exporter protein